MRLRRLDLTRYGRFTDQSIDFGAHVPGTPDLHLVYGPNEAGKSTAFVAFLDLLFGIEPRSRYDFLHSYDAMRIGACLELASGPQELARIKKPQPTLRDANNQALPEGILTGALTGLDRASYKTMFSLDDETIEAGGDSILANKGELGQLLFSASAGLATLTSTIEKIKAEIVTSRPRASSSEIAKLKSSLAELKEKRNAIDTYASKYVQLAGALAEAERQYLTSSDKLRDGTNALARLQALLSALPWLATWRECQPPPDETTATAPLSWMDETISLERGQSRHRSAIDVAAETARGLAARLESLTVDTEALRLTGQRERLDTLRSRHITAEQDLPPRRTDLSRLDVEIKDLIRRAGCEDETEPQRVLLPAAETAVLTRLVGERSDVQTAWADAEKEFLDAGKMVTAARKHLCPAGNAAIPPHVAGQVDSAWNAWRDSDHGSRNRNALAAQDDAQAELGLALAGLAPWTGEAETLAKLAMPDSETVTAWQQDADAQAKAVSRYTDQVSGHKEEVERLSSEKQAIQTVSGLVTADEAAQTRAAREAAWTEHRRTLDPHTADLFEAALLVDDQVVVARTEHAQDLGRLNAATRAEIITQNKLTQAETKQAAAISAQKRMAGEVDAAITLAVPALTGFTPAQLQHWLTRRSKAVDLWKHLEKSGRDARRAINDAETLRLELARVLTAAGDPPGPAAGGAALAEQAKSLLAGEARNALLREDLVRSEAALERREMALQRATERRSQWQGAWHDACSATWIGSRAAPLSVEAVQAVLAILAELEPALKSRGVLAARITAMENDQAEFGYLVERLVSGLTPPIDGQTMAEAADSLKAQIDKAERNRDEQGALKDKFKEAEDTLKRLEAEARPDLLRAEEICTALAASTLSEALVTLHTIKRRDERKETATKASRELCSALRTATVEEAQVVLDNQTESSLRAEEAQLKHDVDLLRDDRQQRFATRGIAQTAIAAVGGDDAAARIESQRRTIILEIEDKAQRYLRLRIGVAAAEQALRRYRDEHRTTMMRDASDAFTTITRGAYRALGTQPGDHGEVLVAIGRAGDTKLAPDLSKGTRFQLYLALRAAGYRAFATVRAPVPFIADDIMETFDDYRAEETLKVLGDMSQLGQVIYLTHHAHLCDIARRVVPGVRIHELLG